MGNSEDAIAIVGMACRLPGNCNSPESLWDRLKQKFDAVEKVPGDRWSTDAYYDPEPGKAGKTNVNCGGYLEGVDLFDPGFFGISNREAACIDPQQRLMLEVAWEAIEDAGFSQDYLSSTSTGVFTGISTFDYMLMQSSFRTFFPPDIYTNTGGAQSMASNRISYCLNLKGPSFSVDTACSSGLLAVHLACESIRRGESKVALAGAVNVIITHNAYLGFSKMGMLSSRGRCQAFSADADGFIRSEGLGVIALKPLKDAIKDGDRIHALISGTGCNQDGATSGITVPNEQSQKELLKNVYTRFGIDPKKVSYIEAHGTGTPIGDPIEARALGEVLGKGRKKPCWMGSVKTNIGHLEAASGLAGLIKAVMVVKNRTVVANLHFEKPNANIDFHNLGLKVPVKEEKLNGKVIAGVNSFGFGGTNVHTVIEEYKTNKTSKKKVSSKDETAKLIPLSARSNEALYTYADDLLSLINKDSSISLDDIYWSSVKKRAHHNIRLALPVFSMEELKDKLKNIRQLSPQRILQGFDESGLKKPLVFVFCGQGAQWHAMGLKLFDSEKVFRDTMQKCHDYLAEYKYDLLGELRKSPQSSNINNTYIAQPALFALQVSLCELWKSRGIYPDAVCGHSVGEVAAAFSAGILTLKEAVQVIFYRAATMAHAPEGGGMIAIGLKEKAIRKILSEEKCKLTVAAVNSFELISLSGSKKEISKLKKRLLRDNIFHKVLDVSHAFHSADMDSVEKPLKEKLKDLKPHKSKIPFYSSVEGKVLKGNTLNADYWWKNVRQKVQFADTISKLNEQAPRAYLEIAPGAVLGSSIKRLSSSETPVLSSISNDEHEHTSFLNTLASFYALGEEISWPGLRPSKDWLKLPAYPWQHQKFWRESPESKTARFLESVHPLLGIRQYNGDYSWVNYISPKFKSLFEHVVQGQILIPGCAFLEMAVSAAKEFFQSSQVRVEDCQILKPCFISEDNNHELTTVINPSTMTFTISGREMARHEEKLTVHARGKIKELTALQTLSPELSKARKDCKHSIEKEDIYLAYSQLGFDFGPSFKGIEKLWIGKNKDALSLIHTPQNLLAENLDLFSFHPSVLDACLQTNIGAILSASGKGFDKNQPIYLPFEYGNLRIYAKATEKMWAYMRLVEMNRQIMISDVFIYDLSGKLLLEIRRFTQKSIGTLASSNVSFDDLFYTEKWQEQTTCISGLPSVLETYNLKESLSSIKIPKTVKGWKKQQLLYKEEAKIVKAVLKGKNYSYLNRKLLAKHQKNLEEVQLPERYDLTQNWQKTLSSHPDSLAELLKCLGLPETEPLFFNCPEKNLNDDLIEKFLKTISRKFKSIKACCITSQPEKLPAAFFQFKEFSWELTGFKDKGSSLHTPLPVTVSKTIVNSVKELANLNFQEDCFDFVFFSDVLYEKADRNQLIKALKPYIKNQGLILIRESLKEHISETFTKGDFTDSEFWLQFAQKNGFADARLFPSLNSAEGQKECILAAVYRKKELKKPKPQSKAKFLIFTNSSIHLEQDRTHITVTQGKQFKVLGKDSYQCSSEKEHLKELFNSVKLSGVTAVLYCWSSIEEKSATDQIAYQKTCELNAFIQTLAETVNIKNVPVCLIFNKAHKLIEGDSVKAEMTALWGFGRTAVNEMPHLDFRLICMGESTQLEYNQLASLIDSKWQEKETVIRRNRQWFNRVSRLQPEVQSEHWNDPRDYNFHLEVLRPGTLESMVFHSYPKQETLEKNQLEIKVHSSALNFSDVLKAMGLYPGIKSVKLPIGIECSGTVTAVGAAVTKFKKGDKVLAVAPFCFAGAARTIEEYTRLKPAGMSFEEAATVPIAFLTAYWALEKLANLQKGERVLIHSATGGVGLAALQLAQHKGAEVFATAGTERKRAFLKLLGVKHIMNSRSLTFADEIMLKTDNEGVDVVLNSLSGEALSQSLSVLRECGRFVEIGKKDIYENNDLSLRPFQKNLSFMVADLDAVIRREPKLLSPVFDRVMEDLKSGKIKPLPYEVFPLLQAELAFRHMGKARHIGKVILCSDNQSVPLIESNETEIRFKEKAAYLITGGYGGLGLILAEWLAANGAGTIALLGRSGFRSEADRKRIAFLEEKGLKVLHCKADISDKKELRTALAKISKSAPLKGIFHCAMVLQDGLIVNTYEEQIEKVFSPKVKGAVNLHEETSTLDLDHFVLFSSMSSVFGNPGQAAYSAANAFLDGLAHQRMSEGRKALSVNWGVLSSAGVAAKDKRLLKRFETQGILTVDPEEALKALARLMKLSLSQACFMRIEWPKVTAVMNKSAKKFSELFQRSADTADQQGAIRDRLSACGPAEQEELIIQLLKEKIAQGLGCDKDELTIDTPLNELGMDSLTGVEFQIWVETELRLNLSIVDLMKGPTIQKLTELLVSKLSDPDTKEKDDDNSGIINEDTALCDYINYLKPVKADSPPRNIFLTGASGFLGAYLLKDLLRNSTVKVHCLVRAKNQQKAFERVKKSMTQFGIWKESMAKQIFVHCGDISKDRFAWTEQKWNKLSKNIELIIHAAASVDFLKAYELQRDVNVKGTAEVIKFANSHKAKAIHHVSTLGVFSLEDIEQNHEINENRNPQFPEKLRSGYFQTKAIAEQLLRTAQKNGTAVSIHRPGVISGDSQNGNSNLADILSRLMLNCINMGSAPEMDMTLRLTPVNFVSRSIASIIFRNPGGGGTYHLLGKEAQWSDIVKWMNSPGLSIKKVPIEEWQEKLIEETDKDGLFSLLPFLTELSDGAEESAEDLNFDSAFTENILKADGIEIPQTDEKLISIYMKAFTKQQ